MSLTASLLVSLKVPVHTSLWSAFVLSSLVFTTGCELEPEVGPAAVERCSNEDSDPDVDVSFVRDVQPLFFRVNGGCAMCHDPGSSNPLGVQLGGLDLSTYASLMRGGTSSGASIVIKGEPCGSDLYLKLTPAPRFGSRMPLDGPPFFNAEELRLVSDWIAEGAQDD